MRIRKIYNFTLSDEVAKLLKDISQKSGLKMSSIVERAIKFYNKSKKHEED